MYFIGIDIGTTNCKLCLFESTEFRLKAKYSFPTPKTDSLITSDFDIEKICEGIETGLIEITQNIEDTREIKNISVASVGESGVLIDEDENITGPVMTWYDTRTKEISQKTIEKLGKKNIYKITGLPAHSNYSLNKILWTMKNITEADKSKNRKQYKWLCMAEFIAYRLSGVKKAEYSLASRTMALDIKNKKWSREILGELGLSTELFPDFTGSGKAIGVLKREIAEKIKLNTEITISIAGHDHMCGSVAAGLWDKKGMLNSTGTTEGFLFLQRNPRLEDSFYEANLSNGIHVDENFNTIYASLPSAGYVIEWFKKKFGVSDDEFEQITEILYRKITENSCGGNEQSSLNSLGIRDSRKNNGYGIFIPHLRGSGPPRRSIDSRGLFYGITENITKEDMLLIIFQSLCFELKNLLDSIERLVKENFEEIRVIGSACKNKLWLKLKADILGRKILVCKADEAVSRGAAMLGAYKNGYIQDKKCCLKRENGEIEEILPDRNLSEYYDDIFKKVYKRFYDFKLDIEKEIY